MQGNNSWNTPLENQFADHKVLGRLIIIPGDDWDSGAYLTDASVSDTWEEADFSEYVPQGTQGLYLYAFMQGTDAADRTIMIVRGDGETGGVGDEYRVLRLDAELGANDLSLGACVSIYAPGGIFDYRSYSSFPIDYLKFVLRGYYQP